MKSGVVPQQPPRTVTPRAAASERASANSSGVIVYAPVAGSGRPAFGLRISGLSVQSASSRTSGISSAGPREQLKPIASTPRPSSVSAIAGTVTPRNVRPVASNVIVTQTGRRVCSFAASTAALTSYRSLIVSITTRSAPAASPATTISRKMSYASSNESVPSGSRSWPIGPTSSATRAFVPAAAARAQRTPASISSAGAWPHLASFIRFAPKVFV